MRPGTAGPDPILRRASRCAAVLGAALCIGAAFAEPPEPAPGEYITESGWGTLSIDAGAASARQFHLDSVGANGHSCTLDGRLDGATGQTLPSSPGERVCQVRFAAAADGSLEVSALDHDVCRGFCGARADFEGTYLAPSAGCGAAARRQVHDDFLDRYRAGRYAESLQTLAPLLTRCATTLRPEEAAKVRNDLAVTLFHLGRPADCLSALEPLRADTADTALDELKQHAPSDFETWSKIARTTRHNLAMCASRPR